MNLPTDTREDIERYQSYIGQQKILLAKGLLDSEIVSAVVKDLRELVDLAVKNIASGKSITIDEQTIIA